MNLTRRLLTTLFASSGLLVMTGASVAAPKEGKPKKGVHHDGKKLVSNKLGRNGKHEIDKKGPQHVSVDVKDGKIAGMHVKHEKKGELRVTKYKTSKKMARADGIHYASYQLAQAQSLGVTYIGYAYIDEDGYEVIYWFPYEMIYDGETGAVEYVPVY